MEEKSTGLDGVVYVKTPLAEGARYSMAGDPGFSGSDNMGDPSMANNSNSNGRYRAVDLSIRTGEEFSMPFSTVVMNGGGIRAENKAPMYFVPGGWKVQMVEGESNQGLMGQSMNMMNSNNNMTDFSERGNLGTNFGGAYPYHGGVYGELPTGFHNDGGGGDWGLDDGTAQRQAPPDDVGGGYQKVKLMCSFGGKILPRPSDMTLRYVGGQTRIITVSRGIGFIELRRKVIEVYGQALVIKYQLPNEDLDALVSVSCDEDIANMMDEYERHMEGSGEGSSRLRLFLSSASESDLVHLAALGDRKSSEQWYVDAVNGITEMGLGKYGDSSAESWPSSDNLIRLDSAGNANSILPDQGGMSGPLPSKAMPQGVGNSGAPSISSPVSSMAGFFPEQQANTGGNAYSAFRPSEVEGGYQDLEYRGSVSSAASFRNEPHLKVAGSRREPESSIHKRVESEQEKFDASQPVVNLRSDGMLPPMDPHRAVLQQSTPSMYWQHPTQNAYMYIQHPNADGGPIQPVQPPFQQHSLQGAHLNNPWPSQQQTDFFRGSYPDKPVSTHVQAHMASTTASLQPTSTPQSPSLFRQQIPLSQQHVQMHHPRNSAFLEQPSYGTGLHYYEHSVRAHHPLSLPSQYQGQGYEQFMQQEPLHDQLSYPEEHLNQQRVMHHAHSDNFLPKHVTKPVTTMYVGIPISQGHHSDGSTKQAPSNVSDSYLHEGIMAPGDHQDMMARRYQTGIQGKDFQPMVSGQQGYTISRGGMEYVVEVPSSYIHEKQDGANYVYQNITQEMNLDVASRGRMVQSETKQEVKSAELSGSHLTPAAISSGIAYSEDPYDLSGADTGLSDSYHTYQLSDKLETFEPTQFKHTITTGDAGTMGFLPDPVQATKTIARMNEAAVSSSGMSVKEVRSMYRSEESTIAEHVSSVNSLLSGSEQQSIDEQFGEVNLSSCAPNTEGEPCISSEMSSTWWNGKPGADCDKVDMSHIVHMTSGELGEHNTADSSPIPDIIAQNESPSNLIFMAEQHPQQLLVERPVADVRGNPTFILPVDSKNTRFSNKTKEAGVNTGPVMLPESLSLQHAMPVQVKKTVDNDSEYSVVDICSKTSSFDKIKDGNSYSAVPTLPVSKSESDSVMDHLKDISASNVITSKVTDIITSIGISPTSNISVSSGLLAKEQETYAEQDAMKDGFSVGLSSPALPLSDTTAEGVVTKGELQDFAEDASVASIQPNISHDPAPSLNEWDCATKDGKAQGNTSEIKQLNGVEDEMILDSDSTISEEIKDMIESDAVIKEASQHGLQTIMNADLEELRELGSGTFGTVYHGKWRGTDVAIKRIKNSCFVGKSCEQERLRTDFWREARILAQLHHPNVVAFYGVVPDGPGSTLATVTEYMVNGSLRQVLQRKDKYRGFDTRKRLIISMDAAFGMEYLHGKNIVHFDLKCENLLVNMRDPHRPICKVGDLGLSKIKHQTLVSGGIQGTLPWMAPELLNGSSGMVSEKVDVFSFGIVMWELLTGEEPYANMHYGQIIGGIVNNTLRPTVPPSCDPAWKSLMERCWSADPTARPSFTEITNGLRAMAAALPPKGQAQHAQVPAQPQN